MNIQSKNFTALVISLLEKNNDRSEFSNKESFIMETWKKIIRELFSNHINQVDKIYVKHALIAFFFFFGGGFAAICARDK